MSDIQKFNIVTEDGSMYKNVAVLCNKGFARDVRDVRVAIKYEHQIIIISKKHMNVRITGKVFYDVELAK